MNLRLDSESIRLRVTHGEALRLARDLEITEQLPVFQDQLRLRVLVRGSSLGFSGDLSKKCIDLYLPKERLETLLSTLSSGGRPKKEECEVTESLQIGGRSVEIRFEVDRQSINSKGELKYEAIPS